MLKKVLFFVLAVLSSSLFAVDPYVDWLASFDGLTIDDDVQSEVHTPRTPQPSAPVTALPTPFPTPGKFQAKASPAKTIGHSVEVSLFLKPIQILQSALEVRQFLISGVFGLLPGTLVSGIQSNCDDIQNTLTMIATRELNPLVVEDELLEQVRSSADLHYTRAIDRLRIMVCEYVANKIQNNYIDVVFYVNDLSNRSTPSVCVSDINCMITGLNQAAQSLYRMIQFLYAHELRVSHLVDLHQKVTRLRTEFSVLHHMQSDDLLEQFNVDFDQIVPVSIYHVL